MKVWLAFAVQSNYSCVRDVPQETMHKTVWTDQRLHKKKNEKNVVASMSGAVDVKNNKIVEVNLT